MTKAEREKLIAKQMAILNVSRAEAEEIVAEDERIDRLTMGELKEECGEEAWAVMKEMTSTGERKTAKTAENQPKTGKKAPTNFKFDTKPKKKDDEKEDFIAKLAEMLGNVVENVEIANPNREICFKIGENEYSLTLTKHRKPKS